MSTWNAHPILQYHHRTALQNQMPEILNLTTLQCSVVYNVGNSLLLIVTLVASIGDDITPTGCTSYGRAQEKKRWRGSGTAVAKCLSLTAALSFPEPALFQGGPCKKINIYGQQIVIFFTKFSLKISRETIDTAFLLKSGAHSSATNFKTLLRCSLVSSINRASSSLTSKPRAL